MLCSPQTPRRMLAAVSLLVALVASPALGAPAALTDVSRTTIDVHTVPREFKSNSPRFSVTLHRVDDLVSESGAIVAERRATFELSFDVAYGGDNSLLLNGVPVAANMVHQAVQVEAGLLVDSSKLRELENASGTTFRTADDVRNGVMKAFDVGLATVEVRVQVTTMYVRFAPDAPPLHLRRFTLSEKVVEVNGQSVVQTAFGEQVYYVAPDGRFVGLAGNAEWAYVSGGDSAAATGVPAAASAMKSAVSGGWEGSVLRTRLAHWFRGLSPFSAVLLVSSLVAAGLAGVIASMVAVVRIVRFSRGGVRSSEDVEKTGDAKALTYAHLPTNEKIPVCPPSYETLVDDAQAGTDAEEVSVSLQPGEGETENDALCQ